MKLLTQAGLLYNVAVTSETVDGHYGTFPEIDWIASWTEAAQVAAFATATTGLSPQVMGLRTTYDGGKILAGFGYFTGTATAGWAMKVLGAKECNSGTAAVIAPTGYVSFAVIGGTSITTCASKSAWLFT